MRITPSGREIRRAERRLLRRVFGAMLIVTLAFIAIVVAHHLFG